MPINNASETQDPQTKNNNNHIVYEVNKPIKFIFTEKTKNYLTEVIKLTKKLRVANDADNYTERNKILQELDKATDNSKASIVEDGRSLNNSIVKYKDPSSEKIKQVSFYDIITGKAENVPPNIQQQVAESYLINDAFGSSPSKFVQGLVDTVYSGDDVNALVENRIKQHKTEINNKDISQSIKNVIKNFKPNDLFKKFRDGEGASIFGSNVSSSETEKPDSNSLIERLKTLGKQKITVKDFTGNPKEVTLERYMNLPPITREALTPIGPKNIRKMLNYESLENQISVSQEDKEKIPSNKEVDPEEPSTNKLFFTDKSGNNVTIRQLREMPENQLIEKIAEFNLPSEHAENLKEKVRSSSGEYTDTEGEEYTNDLVGNNEGIDELPIEFERDKALIDLFDEDPIDLFDEALIDLFKQLNDNKELNKILADRGLSIPDLLGKSQRELNELGLSNDEINTVSEINKIYKNSLEKESKSFKRTRDSGNNKLGGSKKVKTADTEGSIIEVDSENEEPSDARVEMGNGVYYPMRDAVKDYYEKSKFITDPEKLDVITNKAFNQLVDSEHLYLNKEIIAGNGNKYSHGQVAHMTEEELAIAGIGIEVQQNIQKILKQSNDIKVKFQKSAAKTLANLEKTVKPTENGIESEVIAENLQNPTEIDSSNLDDIIKSQKKTSGGPKSSTSNNRSTMKWWTNPEIEDDSLEQRAAISKAYKIMVTTDNRAEFEKARKEYLGYLITKSDNDLDNTGIYVEGLPNGQDHLTLRQLYTNGRRYVAEGLISEDILKNVTTYDETSAKKLSEKIKETDIHSARVGTLELESGQKMDRWVNIGTGLTNTLFNGWTAIQNRLIAKAALKKNSEVLTEQKKTLEEDRKIKAAERSHKLNKNTSLSGSNIKMS
jgi:hypothetical protein